MTRRNRFLAGVAVFSVAASLYLLSNWYHFFPPLQLPMTVLDLAVPFIPQTIWIYVGEYFLFLAVFCVSRDMENLNRYLYALLAIHVISAAIFLVWPTTYPRELFPLSQDLDPLTYAVFNGIRQTDSPASCCPSLHVSCVYLSSFLFFNERRKMFWAFFIWATLISVSTLTTKQHYFVDIVMGLGLALGMYYFIQRRIVFTEFTRKSGNKSPRS
ncbi:phosphatase PAP2 family protein [Bdellovibrionota bacterium FG-2]